MINFSNTPRTVRALAAIAFAFAFAGCNDNSSTGAATSSDTMPAPAAAANSPEAYPGASLAPEAHASLDQARSLALAAWPGVIGDQELEREAGGSGLRYSFDIRSNDVAYEVGIDAQDGAVLENQAEGPNPD